MELVKSKNCKVNYLSKIVFIDEFHPHPNADRMKIAKVGGYEVAMSSDDNPGFYVYFPTNSKINGTLLSFCNLYRHSSLNANPEKSGFFEDNGRVKAIKLRGVPSEGFLLPIEILNSYLVSNLNLSLSEDYSKIKDVEFDTIKHDGKELNISEKYVSRQVYQHSNRPPRKLTWGEKLRRKILGMFERIDSKQFRFHYDTVLVKKCPWVIRPSDIISITSKVHGTSGISAYVLCNKKQTPFGAISNILHGKKLKDGGREYDYVYSSRKVIKDPLINNGVSDGYYGRDNNGYDVYKYANDVVRPHLVKGMSVYYEIAGYSPNGKLIQGAFDYGCVPPESESTFEYGKNFKVFVYRVTMTNVDGTVHEFSAREVQLWAKANDLVPVKEFYYGYAKDLYDIEVPKDEFGMSEWTTEFFQKMSNDKNFYMEEDSPECSNKVPQEGVVIKREDGMSHAWKLKTWRFLNKEQEMLDKGEIDMEEEN